MQEDNILLIDKPAGITSFGVVARVRRKYSQYFGKKMKVGHTGTLDPFATGLMIIVTGKECKNASLYSKLDKVYEATFRLGQTSTTGDPEGEISDISERVPSAEEVEGSVKKFVGKITQKPPVYSAIKIAGQRAYDLARKGVEVDMPTREVDIFSIEIIEYLYPELRIRTHVGSGTYVRTLAEDIGADLGVGAYCSHLRRTRVGDSDIKDAERLEA